MCGRIVQDLDEEDLAREVREIRIPPLKDWRRNYNLGPMQNAVIIGRDEDGARAARVFRWGLVPSWVKDETHAKRLGAACVNARADGVATKPAFRAAFAKRRCLVPVSGWYEWSASPNGKVPHYFHAACGELLLLAGLWERWKNPENGDEVRSFAVITTEPNALAARIHARMPVVLARGAWDTWLAPATARDELVALLRPCAEGMLAVHVVGKAVGDARNNTPDLIAPIRAA